MQLLQNRVTLSEIRRAEIIQCANSWINTPFHPQGRLKNIGCDCVGLILGICKELKIKSIFNNQALEKCDINYYNHIKDGALVDHHFSKHFHHQKINPENLKFNTSSSHHYKKSPILQAGDVISFKFSPTRYHIAIISDYIHKKENNESNFKIIHSCLQKKVVNENILYSYWVKYIDKVLYLL